MDDLILLDWGAFTLFLLILMRMSGFIVLNPIFSRDGVPKMTTAGLVLILSVVVYSIEGGRVTVPNTDLELIMMLLMELCVGMVFSMMMHIVFAVTTIGGSTIDMQIGFSMAQAYDPATGATVTVSANVLSALMILIFFLENGHHTLLRLIMTSSTMIPYGDVYLSDLMIELMVQVFVETMILGLKLTMPILAAELLGQVGMGLLMKAIPQINVFVINIDLKVIIGLCLLIIFLPDISNFLLDIEIEMLNNLQKVLISMANR